IRSMKRALEKSPANTDISSQSTAELRAMVAALQAQLQQRDIRIELLEEMLRLKRVQQFAARSEKSIYQAELFDEAETEAEIEALAEQLPEADAQAAGVRPRRQRRQRGFSEVLARERIELPLADEDKVGASKVF